MPTPPPEGTSTLNPRARHSGRAVSFIVLILVVLLVLGHLLWRDVERRRFMAAVQRLQQAGEPVLMDDFNHAPTSDPNNPVPEWRAAAAALDPVTTGESQDQVDVSELQFPLTDREVAMLRKVVGANQMMLAHAEVAARKTGKPEWDIQFQGSAIAMLLPRLGPDRTIASVLSAAAMDAHQRGDDSAAAARLWQMLALSRAMYRQPGMVGHLVGIGIGELASDTLQKIAPDLRVGSSSDTSERAASVEQTRQLISELLDDRAQREGQRYAFQTERMFQADVALQWAEGNISGQPSAPRHKSARLLLSPLAYADGRIMLDHTSKVMALAASPDWPTCHDMFRRLPDPKQLGRRHLLVTILIPAFDRVLLQDFRYLTDKRLLAIDLAVRWYAVDHEGRFPAKLDDLVPEYLPAIPADPMTTGSSLRYRPGDNPVVYSVGEDRVDDGGSEQPLDPNRPDFRWNKKDAVVHLTRQPRKPKTDDADEQEASEQPPSSDATTEPSTQPTTSPSADLGGS